MSQSYIYSLLLSLDTLFLFLITKQQTNSGITDTRSMEKTLTNLRVAYTIGNITVETRDLKRRLMPTITSIMDDMKNVLVDTTKMAVTVATDQLKQQVSSMLLRIVQLDKFAESVDGTCFVLFCFFVCYFDGPYIFFFFFFFILFLTKHYYSIKNCA